MSAYVFVRQKRLGKCDFLSSYSRKKDEISWKHSHHFGAYLSILQLFRRWCLKYLNRVLKTTANFFRDKLK